MRRPRYAIGFVLGVGYVALLFVRPGNVAFTPPRRPFGGAGPELASLGLVVLAARWWLFGTERTALAFAPAEVDFLFPAPLTRRQLILYKLLRAQLAILVSAGIWTALVARGGAVAFPLRAVGMWVLLATLHLHQLGASLVRSSTVEQGRSGLRRQAPALILFLAVVVALLWGVLASVPALRAAATPAEALRALSGALHQPAARVVLWVFRILLAPSVAPTVAAWAWAMIPALALLVGHGIWVLRSDTAFEEAAVDASARRARRLDALRARRAPADLPSSGTRRAWLPLAPTGHPAGAIVWKNIIAQTRAFRLGLVVRFLLGAGVGFIAVASRTQGTVREFLALFVGSWALLLLVAGPLWVRNDLRLDLSRLELLRGFPLSGTAVVGAELLASALTLTTVQAIVLVMAAVLLTGTDVLADALPLPRAAIVGVALAVPVVNTATLCIQNALALLFPDWGRRGLTGPGGVEMIGQNMLATVGTLLLLGVALIGPGVIALLVGRLLWGWLGEAGIVATTLLAAGALLAETWVCVRWLGRVFERTEPAVGGGG